MSPRLATSRHVLCTAAADRERCTRVLCMALAGESAGRLTPAVVIHAVQQSAFAS